MQVDAALLFKLWHDTSVSEQELRELLGVGKSALYRLKQQYALPRRRYVDIAPKEEDEDDQSPTQAEIAERAAAIRAGWSAQERRSRTVQKCGERWEPPAYKYNHRDAVFSC